MATAVLAGLGGFLPSNTITNEALAERLDTSDEWIRRRTGISERRVAEPGLSNVQMAVAAGSRAIESAGGCGVDVVLVASTTPDRPVPAAAPEIAYRLGLSGVAACDVSAVCSGFVYLLGLGSGLIALGQAEQVLLVAAERYSRIVDPDDRGTAVIFGDGAGAAVLRAGAPDEAGALLAIDLGSDGQYSDLITVENRQSRLAMRGTDVFRHAIDQMTVSCQRVLDRTGWTAEQVGALVPHQANQRITEAVGRRLGIPPRRQVSNIDRLGNTAAASIPLALIDGDQAGLLPVGAKVLLTAFGGGLSWGSATLTWPDLKLRNLESD